MTSKTANESIKPVLATVIPVTTTAPAVHTPRENLLAPSSSIASDNSAVSVSSALSTSANHASHMQKHVSFEPKIKNYDGEEPDNFETKGFSVFFKRKPKKKLTDEEALKYIADKALKSQSKGKHMTTEEEAYIGGVLMSQDEWLSDESEPTLAIA